MKTAKASHLEEFSAWFCMLGTTYHTRFPVRGKVGRSSQSVDPSPKKIP